MTQSSSVRWLSRTDGVSVVGLCHLLEERVIMATRIIASPYETSAHIGFCSTVLIKCRTFIIIIKLIATKGSAQYYIGILKNVD